MEPGAQFDTKWKAKFKAMHGKTGVRSQESEVGSIIEFVQRTFSEKFNN